jgi:formate hydrogenlyase subunit 3/multisubunit Na+/H+ antiporter MnhD subunit
VGFVAGCWLTLRLPRYPYAGRTAALLAAFLVVGVYLLFGLFYRVLGDNDIAPLFYACLVWVPLVSVLLARYIALRLHNTL